MIVKKSRGHMSPRRTPEVSRAVIKHTVVPGKAPEERFYAPEDSDEKEEAEDN